MQKVGGFIGGVRNKATNSLRRIFMKRQNGRQKRTDGATRSEQAHRVNGRTPGAESDPYVVEVVKYLARRAAERDYKEFHNRRSVSDRPSGGKRDSE